MDRPAARTPSPSTAVVTGPTTATGHAGRTRSRTSSNHVPATASSPLKPTTKLGRPIWKPHAKATHSGGNNTPTNAARSIRFTTVALFIGAVNSAPPTGHSQRSAKVANSPAGHAGVNVP
ncbi:hypothetical protein Ais01nite_58340 [Asanoa ishikariensis]|nr:hypothetical protein Ais01nite_58340 [Asanoa ishikariensis]